MAADWLVPATQIDVPGDGVHDPLDIHPHRKATRADERECPDIGRGKGLEHQRGRGQERRPFSHEVVDENDSLGAREAR
jgi:hypothetical protein